MGQIGHPPRFGSLVCPGAATVTVHRRPGCASLARRPGPGVPAQGGCPLPCPLPCERKGRGAVCARAQRIMACSGGGAPPAGLVAGVALGGGARQGGLACPTPRLALLPVARGAPRALRLWEAWCSWAPGAVQGVWGVSGKRVSLRRRARTCTAPRWRRPRPPGGTPSRVSAAAGAHHGKDPGLRSCRAACPPQVTARGQLGGGVCSGSGGQFRWGGDPGSLACGPLTPSAFAIRHSTQRVPGHCYGLCPWVPLSPAPPLLWRLELRRWRVPQAVAPVDKGGAGLRAARHWPLRG